MENKLEKVMVRKGVRGWESRKGLLDAEEATVGKIVSELDSAQQGPEAVFTGCAGTERSGLPDDIT